MGYLFLAIALIASGAKGFCGKKTSDKITLSSDSMVMNTLRMVLCVFISLSLLLVRGDGPSLLVDTELLGITLLSGISSALFVVSWLLSVKTGAYMMVEIFLLIGTGVPIVLSRILFQEMISTKQVIGIIILFVSAYIMCTYNASIKGKMKLPALSLLFLCGISNGFSDFSQKLFVKIHPDVSVVVFNFYTYLSAGIILLFTCLIFRHGEKKRGIHAQKVIHIIRPSWIYILIMAACLYTSSFFKTQAAIYLDAMQLYPLNQGMSLLISLFMSSVFFKERINVRCTVGVILSLCALLMINL